MALHATTVGIYRVENGFLLTCATAGGQVQLVARGLDELLGLLRGIEWQTDRPLPSERKYLGEPQTQPPPGAGGGEVPDLGRIERADSRR